LFEAVAEDRDQAGHNHDHGEILKKCERVHEFSLIQTVGRRK
jgi:hypothetical protein